MRGFETLVVGLDGSPASATALAWAIDHLVVGPHGTALNRLVIGSVTRKILHRSDRPTIVAKGSADVGGPVVSFVGYGEATEGAARWAAQRAAAEATGLVLVHAVGHRPRHPIDSPADTVASYLGSEVADDWARADLERIKSELAPEAPDVAIGTRVVRGSVVAAVELISPGSRLVVVGKRHTTRLARRRVSHRLQQTIVRSSATVAVVPSCPPAAP